MTTFLFYSVGQDAWYRVSGREHNLLIIGFVAAFICDGIDAKQDVLALLYQAIKSFLTKKVCAFESDYSISL